MTEKIMSLKKNDKLKAALGDEQAVKRLWEENRENLIAGVFNPFGLLSRRELECRAVFTLLCKIERFGSKIRREKQ